MATKFRKEKYISAQQKGNSTFLLVKFQYGADKRTYTKTFNVADYPSPKEAMNAACRHRDVKRAELGAGFMEEKKLTIDQVKDIYIAKKHMASNTRRSFNTYYSKYIQPEYGKRYIDTITSLEVEESMAKLRETKSDNVLRHINEAWSSLFSTARKIRALKYNIMEEVTVPKSRYYPSERTKKVTNDEDIAEVLKALGNASMHARRESARYNARLLAYMVIVCRCTGIRPAECYAIRREVIDFDRHELTIDCMYGSDEYGKAIVSAKTQTSVRRIPLTMPAELALRGAMDMSANEYIFTTYNGQLFTPQRVQSTMRTAKIDGTFSLYTLRHQFSSDLITGNVDPRTVMELMGHKNMSMTIGTYARSNDDVKRNAVEEIGRRNSENADVYCIN